MNRLNVPGDAASARRPLASARSQLRPFAGQHGVPARLAPQALASGMASPAVPLEPALRRDMEQRFGHDFSRVRVHADAAAGRSAHDFAARAYTAGQDIVFGAGRFAPATDEGRRLIAHELMHVADGSSGAAGTGASARWIQREPEDVPREAAGGGWWSAPWEALKETARTAVKGNLGVVEGVALEGGNLADTALFLQYAKIDLLDSIVNQTAELAGVSGVEQEALRSVVQDAANLDMLPVNPMPSVEVWRRLRAGAQQEKLVDITQTPSLSVAIGEGFDHLDDWLDRNAFERVAPESTALVLTARDWGQVTGALGTQAFLALWGPEEVQVALKMVAAAGAVKGIVASIEIDQQNHKSWISDTDVDGFWWRVVQAALFVLGLGSSAGRKITSFAINSAGSLLSTLPVVKKLLEDLALPPGPEREKRIEQDAKALVIGVAQALQSALADAKKIRDGDGPPSALEGKPVHVAAPAAPARAAVRDADPVTFEHGTSQPTDQIRPETSGVTRSESKPLVAEEAPQLPSLPAALVAPASSHPAAMSESASAGAGGAPSPKPASTEHQLPEAHQAAAPKARDGQEPAVAEPVLGDTSDDELRDLREHPGGTALVVREPTAAARVLAEQVAVEPAAAPAPTGDDQPEALPAPKAQAADGLEAAAAEPVRGQTADDAPPVLGGERSVEVEEPGPAAFDAPLTDSQQRQAQLDREIEALRQRKRDNAQALAELNPVMQAARADQPVVIPQKYVAEEITTIAEVQEHIDALLDDSNTLIPKEIRSRLDQLDRELAAERGITLEVQVRLDRSFTAISARVIRGAGRTDQVFGGRSTDLTVDHIVPQNEILQMPGFNRLPFGEQVEVLHADSNLVVMSRSANSSKGSKSWLEWDGSRFVESAGSSTERWAAWRLMQQQWTAREDALRVSVQAGIDARISRLRARGILR